MGYSAGMDYLKSAAYWVRAARHPKAALDQVAAQNYLLPAQVHRQVRHRQLQFLEDILRRCKTPPRVLDLGCGPGWWATQLAHLARSWSGFDIAPSFIEHARREAQEKGLAHLQFEVSNLLTVDQGRNFEVVVLGGTLGYINDWDLRPLMENVRAHLVPEGVVYVRVSVIPGIYPRVVWNGEYQIAYRKPAEYLEVFQKAGFSATCERDYAFTEGSLATAYTALARWLGRTGMTAYRNALRLRPLSFGLARILLDLTPLPQSMQFVLRLA
ncbi:MAG: class I SAM-dependent methyltransferase [Candidatus Eremiobacteraeota bacterium]|nr:class I SAM-dependent methyltransferase [Candidatus Eremiobacteraeota bacterium]MCW5869889.1 class I SAM-dependent methyltransferase [Candidatus Eremiobacteraeota bacterium]